MRKEHNFKAIHSILRTPEQISEIPIHKLIQIDFWSGDAVKADSTHDFGSSSIYFQKRTSDHFEPVNHLKAIEFKKN